MIETLILNLLPTYLQNKYLVSGIIFAAFLLISKLFVYLARKILLSITIKTNTKLDDLLVERTNGPISWLLIFVGARIALEYMELQNGFGIFLSRTIDSMIYLGSAIVIISILVVLIDHWGKVFAKKTKSTLDDALIPLFRSSAKVIILIIIAIMVLDIWGVNVAGLLAGVGIAGIAIGFAVQDTLKNIFGGVSLIVDKTFNVGDQIALDDGTIGNITDISVRATRFKTFDNEEIIVPNGMLANMKVKNFHHPDSTIRVSVLFSVEYGTDPEKVKKLVLGEIIKIKDILKTPAPNVVFVDMGDFALNMKAMFWINDVSNVAKKRDEATTLIYSLLNKNKIGIPFPTRTVYLKK